MNGWTTVCVGCVLALLSRSADAGADSGDDEPRRDEPEAARRWEVGALVGHTLVDDEFALGNATTPAGVLDRGVITGVRLGHRVSSKFSVELEGTYSEPGFADLADSANVFGYRIHAIGHLIDGDIRPFVLGGVGGQYVHTDAPTVSSDADKEVYWGIGAAIRAGTRTSVRADLRHRIASGRVARFSNLFEGAIGVSWAF